MENLYGLKMKTTKYPLNFIISPQSVAVGTLLCFYKSNYVCESLAFIYYSLTFLYNEN